MQASFEKGISTSDFEATISVDNTAVAEARVVGKDSIYLLYRYTAESDDTEVSLAFAQSPPSFFDDTYVQYAAKIYKNEPNQNEHQYYPLSSDFPADCD